MLVHAADMGEKRNEIFFLKRFIAQKIQRYAQGYKIVPLTNLP